MDEDQHCSLIPLKQAEENYANPKTAFFHSLFKVAAVVFYILCTFVSSSYIIHFVVTVVLVAFDFWTVKNVSGRILVGLRWWNESNEHGESSWRFESLDPQSMEHLNKKDSGLFWWALYINAAVWIVLGLVALLKLNFDYLLIVAVAVTLNSANIAGYTKVPERQQAFLESMEEHAACRR